MDRGPGRETRDGPRRKIKIQIHHRKRKYEILYTLTEKEKNLLLFLLKTVSLKVYCTVFPSLSTSKSF